MARSLLLFFIMADAFLVFATADLKSDSPDSSSTSAVRGATLTAAQETTNRKLGRHQMRLEMAFGGPSASPSRALAQSEASSSDLSPTSLVEQELLLVKQKHHSSADKSVAGGGVILGGLATTFLVAVFCYIRATGRHKSESEAASNTADNA
ncbi:uncharacterized protein LOC104433073 [Eucalyptus grandis]|uniref:Uncharacterized protein n=3 Tax=Eucalyptus TaxID=3932 RepID=A0ACC3M347_EUCGR|nr:uncharacterized protein LOC104433073 [Eucalyptus grandis]KAK3445187.1 hypothetical protein EUGRSUZ_B02728 [Eucalyptus grandis]